jgi:hypothetical protein
LTTEEDQQIKGTEESKEMKSETPIVDSDFHINTGDDNKKER